MNRHERGLYTLQEILEKHRDFTPGKEEQPTYQCTLCNDRTFVEFLIMPDGNEHQLSPDLWGYAEQWNHPTSRLARRACDCAQQRAAQARLKAIFTEGGVPERYHRFTFDTWAALPSNAREGKEKMLNFCVGYASAELTPDSPKFGLVLSGAPGLGKTGLAFCILMEKAKRGQVVLWSDWTELVNKARAAVGDPTIDMEKVIDTACNVPFLLIDDLGDMQRKAETTDFVRDMLYTIISRRYGRNRELLITTNLNYMGFEAQFGERIASRVWQMCAWVDATGQNLRKG